ncbi:MAG: NAD(P)H-dependent oxidoreductase subunit E [Paracoccaceae bacterium]|jgi:formate dehydrogenase|nr:NADH-quinone oxidoreductase subunit F [Paracoccaceae bacterium]MCH1563161.1 NAD(P)H-dependent oxidoreductase subunit E [Paracoccaceae bacterium]NCX53849.1 NADH-quinone oxidoreductase subunit F [Rhodobacterales bacterium]NCX57270.1 NADH-quinone oxidoreductase subunit F [Paracoccaceae bacterium]GIR85009.1 MAG: NADH-quinone oxidoreductase subunit F [Rhodobacterales bacterium]|tara:strand:+ start:78 stop:1763 length:1686 start_codon:yes stop_codon:yes gene_type:complete
MALDQDKGVWKSAKGKGRRTPKGRQFEDEALNEVKALLENRPRQKDLLIEFLHLIQDKYGYLSAQHLCALAEELKISMAEVYEVASFYAHFDIVKEDETPPPQITIRVCDSLSCELAGAEKLREELKKGLDPKEVRVVRAPCMGRCDAAPTLELGHNHIDRASTDKVQAAISEGHFHCSIPEYERFQKYFSLGGYQTLLNLRLEGNWEDIQNKILASGLRGLGGAGFPSGKKWGFVRMNEGPRFIAVNGDEGEPGTFKDRFYLERTPHLFLEGMLIAAWAVEAEKAYIYMRDEYPAVLKILKEEITALEQAGIVEPGYIELRRGAGAYICGEESAMIESIEGKRGLPRHRPPFVAQVGLFGRPTLVHNVETLHWIARICREGPEILNSVEKNGRKGLRTYSVSGRVKDPGIYLLPAGSTILDIIDAAGGMMKGHTFKAYQPGGPSSGLLPSKLNDVPMDFDTLQPYDTFIGSAAVVILSDKDSARAAALNMLKFFEDESCGQCTPCRVGCEKAVKLMEKKEWDTELLEEVCKTMVDASICGLGQAAPNAIKSTIKYFNDEI